MTYVQNRNDQWPNQGRKDAAEEPVPMVFTALLDQYLNCLLKSGPGR